MTVCTRRGLTVAEAALQVGLDFRHNWRVSPSVLFLIRVDYPMPTTAEENLVQPQITSDQALKIARLDAERAYRDLTPYRVRLELDQDGWHVDYELKNRQVQGGGAHYVIDAHTGMICFRKYEQ